MPRKLLLSRLMLHHSIIVGFSVKVSVCLDCCCPSRFLSLVPKWHNIYDIFNVSECVHALSIKPFSVLTTVSCRVVARKADPLTLYDRYRLTYRFGPATIGQYSWYCGRGSSFIFTINELSMAEPPWPILNRFTSGRGQACNLANLRRWATRPRWPDDKAWYHV